MFTNLLGRADDRQVHSAEGGFQGAGINADFFLPTGSDKATIKMNTGFISTGNLAVTSGYGQHPVFYLHPSCFEQVSDDHSFELGNSYLRGKSSDGIHTTNLYGMDFVYNWLPARRGLWRSFVAGGELFFAQQKTINQSTLTPFGYFIYGQYQLGRPWYIGGRFDYSEEIANPDLSTKVLASYLSYYTSEFLRFRFGYEYRLSDFVDQNKRNTIFFEMNLVFGAHPPEPYWVRH